jgi:sec-independent protein translocase protein TatA
MFGSMGITELVLILFIVLIIFGAGKLPQLGEGLGKAIKGFKKSVHEADAIELEASAQQAQMQPPGGQPAADAAAAAQAAQPSATPSGSPPPPQAPPVAPEPPKV